MGNNFTHNLRRFILSLSEQNLDPNTQISSTRRQNRTSDDKSEGKEAPNAESEVIRKSMTGERHSKNSFNVEFIKYSSSSRSTASLLSSEQETLSDFSEISAPVILGKSIPTTLRIITSSKCLYKKDENVKTDVPQLSATNISNQFQNNLVSSELAPAIEQNGNSNSSFAQMLSQELVVDRALSEGENTIHYEDNGAIAISNTSSSALTSNFITKFEKQIAIVLSIVEPTKNEAPTTKNNEYIPTPDNSPEVFTKIIVDPNPSTFVKSRRSSNGSNSSLSNSPPNISSDESLMQTRQFTTQFSTMYRPAESLQSDDAEILDEMKREREQDKSERIQFAEVQEGIETPSNVKTSKQEIVKPDMLPRSSLYLAVSTSKQSEVEDRNDHILSTASKKTERISVPLNNSIYAIFGPQEIERENTFIPLKSSLDSSFQLQLLQIERVDFNSAGLKDEQEDKIESVGGNNFDRKFPTPDILNGPKSENIGAPNIKEDKTIFQESSELVERRKVLCKLLKILDQVAVQISCYEEVSANIGETTTKKEMKAENVNELEKLQTSILQNITERLQVVEESLNQIRLQSIDCMKSSTSLQPLANRSQKILSRSKDKAEIHQSKTIFKGYNVINSDDILFSTSEQSNQTYKKATSSEHTIWKHDYCFTEEQIRRRLDKIRDSMIDDIRETVITNQKDTEKLTKKFNVKAQKARQSFVEKVVADFKKKQKQVNFGNIAKEHLQLFQKPQPKN